MPLVRRRRAACGSCAAGIVGLLRHVAPPIVLAACGSCAAGIVGLLRHVAPPIVLAACGSRAAGFVGLLRHVAPPIVLAACGSCAAGIVGLLRHVAPPIVVGGLRLARRRFRRAPPARGAADRGWRPAARAPQVSSGSSGTWRRRSWLAACGSCAAGIVGLLRHVAPPIVLAACGSRAAGFVGLLRHVAPPIVLAACGSRAAGFVGLLRHVAPPIVVGGLRLARRRFRRAPPARGAADRVAACGSRAAGIAGVLRHVAPPIVWRPAVRAPQESPASSGTSRRRSCGGLRFARRRNRRRPPARGAADRGWRPAARAPQVSSGSSGTWRRRSCWRPAARAPQVSSGSSGTWRRRSCWRPAARAPQVSSGSSGTWRRRSWLAACGSRAAGFVGLLRHVAPPIVLAACGSRAAGFVGLLRHVAPPIGLRARARQLPPRSRSSAHSRSQRVGASFRRRFWDRSGSSGSPAMKSAHENSDRCGAPPSSSPTATRWPRPPSSAGRRDFCGCGRYERPAGGARLLFGYRVRRTGASGAARTAERRAEHRARSDVRPPAHAERTRAGRPSLRWRFGVLRQGHEWQHAKRSRSRGRGCAQAGLGSGCAGRDVQCAHPRDRLADRAAYASLGRSLAKAPRGTRRDARGQRCRRTTCRCARCSEQRGGHR